MAAIGKTLERLEGMVKDGNFYEAQQMYKTVYHRQRAKKQTLSSYQVLESGSSAQFKASQITCGVELGLLLIEAFNEDGEKSINEEALRRLTNLISCFPETKLEEANVEELSRLVKATISWIYKTAGPAAALPAAAAARRLHGQFARYLWRNGRAAALNHLLVHFVRGDDPEAFATAISESAAAGPSSETALWTTRAVLQTLAAASRRSSSRQLAHAAALFAALQQKAVASGGGAVAEGERAAVEARALLHFTEGLLLALRKGSRDMARVVAEKYGPVLSRDETLPALLTRIQKVYFQTRGGGGGGLAGLLGGLLESLGDFGEEDGEEDDIEEEEFVDAVDDTGAGEKDRSS